MRLSHCNGTLLTLKPDLLRVEIAAPLWITLLTNTSGQSRERLTHHSMACLPDNLFYTRSSWESSCVRLPPECDSPLMLLNMDYYLTGIKIVPSWSALNTASNIYPDVPALVLPSICHRHLRIDHCRSAAAVPRQPGRGAIWTY